MQQDMMERFKNHALLDGRNYGASKLLLGEVAVLTFFVNDGESCWTAAAKAEYHAAQKRAMEQLSRKAGEYDVKLRLHTFSGEMTLPGICNATNFHWVKEATARLDQHTVAEYQEYYERRFAKNDAPVIFALNKELRSYASSAEDGYPYNDEYSVVGRMNGSFFPQTIIHELLHQFGAHDFYYPKQVRDAAALFLPGSVMNDGEEIDTVTAYCIGWRNEVTLQGASFLMSTNYVTDADIAAALNDEWKK